MENFRYLSPGALEEVFAISREFGSQACFLAGGTDLLVRMKKGLIHPALLINLKQISRLNRLEVDNNGGLRIGATLPIAEIETHPDLFHSHPLLVEAASSIGSRQIRNQGTIGGNLCNASPAGDMAPPLIALDARVQIESPQGERIVPLENFFLGPGQTILRENEVLTEVHVPPSAGKAGSTYLKFSRRRGLDLATVGVACMLWVNPEFLVERVTIALGAVSPTPVRAPRAEALMTGKKIDPELVDEVSRLAAEEAKPISDIRASADYRREIIRVLVKRGLAICQDQIHPRTVQ